MAAVKQNRGGGRLSGAEKAAVIVMTLDENVSSKLFTQMSEEEIREISQAMVGLGAVEQSIVEGLFSEFIDQMSAGASLVGDVGNAKKILEAALGPDRVGNIMEDISGPIGKNTWDKLNNVSEDLLASFLRNEYPQTAALVLSKLRTSQAARVLTVLPDDFALDVIQRMIAMEPVKKEVIASVEKILQAEFMSNLDSGKKQDSLEMMAEVFNNFDRQSESKFLDLLDKNNPEASSRIRELMFTFEDLIKIDDASIQVILRKVDKEKLVIALKGANDEIRDLFFRNMSERASKIMKEDMESKGPVRLKDVDEAQMAVVMTAKELSDAGEIVIPDGEDADDEMVY